MILGIVQARTSSSRLPGKVLKPILGRPMIALQLERLSRVQSIDKLIVATSDRSDDTPLVSLCATMDIDCFCGSLDDVLDRFYRAAKKYSTSHVVRLTGDCPLTDPDTIDQMVDTYLNGEYDYVSNTIEPTFPDGLDGEVFRMDCLTSAWHEANLPSQREHVTPFIWQQPKRFKLHAYRHTVDLSHMRWTVDEPEDFSFVKEIFQELYPDNASFGMRDVLQLLERRPELGKMNNQIERNEGYSRTLAHDHREKTS
ncbi:MAG: cytidylyltransferase domain-containing protein [Candidatus Zixiibacteriota bacterium]